MSHLGSGAAHPHQGLHDTASFYLALIRKFIHQRRKEPEVSPSSWAPQLFVVSSGPGWLSHGGIFWLTRAQSSCSSHFPGSCGLSGAVSHPHILLHPSLCLLAAGGFSCRSSSPRQLWVTGQVPVLLSAISQQCQALIQDPKSLESSFQHHLSASASSSWR